MRITTLTLSLLLLAGCTTTAPQVEPAASAPAVQLSATLVTPTDITLAWKTQDPQAAGHIVEFATEPQGEYTILQFAPAHLNTFTHPDLIPQTPFYYRVRSYHGPTSSEVDVVLPPGAFDEKTQAADHSWLTPTKVPGGPADLSFAIMHANGIRFTWTDKTNDEDGYLLESRPAGSPHFQVVAFVDPDINSVGLITGPDEKHALYRIRTLYYGHSSNVAHQTTGGDSSG